MIRTAGDLRHGSGQAVAGRHRGFGAAAALTITVALFAVAGCGRSSGPPLRASAARGANLLLVTIDTLRRDRVGAYGSSLHLTPTIDRLAATGVRFTHAFAHAPMTLPSHASILTGRTPPAHGVRNNGTYRLDESVPTVATVLHEQGYRTGAFVGAFVLDARYGLNRGFDVYDDRMPEGRRTTTFRLAERRGADVVQAAGDWITASDPARPWFAWVHLFDPHAPYAAPAEFATGRAPYDGEVAYADAMLGRLLDRVTPATGSRPTLVVVTADHGESLGEHGESTHGLFAYDATIGVPLIVHGPGVAAAVVDEAAGHADLLPTVVDLLGAPAVPGVSGRALSQPRDADRAIYFEAMDAFLSRGWAPLTGVATPRWKLIDLPTRELYDLQADPAEATNLATRDTPTADALERRRRAIVDVPATVAQAAPRDREAERRLRALGYVAGAPTAASGGGPSVNAPDPKTLVALHERFTIALEAFSSGRADEALATFRAILDERPDFTVARASAATVLIAAGRPNDAIALVKAAPAADAAAPELLAKLGVAYRDAGDLDAARAALERAWASGWHNPDVRNDLGIVQARQGRLDEARATFTELTAQSPGAADAWNNLGVLELNAGRPPAAAGAFRKAVAADPALGDAWQGLGAALAPIDPTGAAEAWRHAVDLLPQDLDLLYNLAVLLATGTHPVDAVPYLTRFLRQAPAARIRDRAAVQTLLRQVQR